MPSRASLLFSSIFFVAQIPSICLAQASSGSPAASSASTSRLSSTSSAAAQTHTVQIGLADHKFKPDTTVANVGDTIEFAFYPANHSVVRAEYGFPCIPYEMTGPSKVGFFSGFHSVDTVLASPPTYSVLVNDTDPVFFYCSAPGSCLTYGMIGAINPNPTTNVTQQHQQALDSAYMLNPGESFPAESPLPSNLPSSTAIPGMGNGRGKKGLSGGAIAGIVIGALSVLVLAALLLFFWGRTKSLKDEVVRKAGTVRRVSPSSSTGMLDASRAPGNGVGGGYQHYQQSATTSPPPMEQAYGYSTPGYGTPNFSTPAPSYFSPQQQQQGKFEHMSPVRCHPAHSPPPMGNTVNIHRALSHRSVGGTFELSPTGDYTRTQDTITTASPQQQNPHNHHHHHHHRAASPHCLAAADQEAKLDPYGQQVYGNTIVVQGGATLPEGTENIPTYFESVYRPGPMHVNGHVGPAEMDSTETARGPERSGSVPAPAVRPAWEEVEKRGMF